MILRNLIHFLIYLGCSVEFSILCSAMAVDRNNDHTENDLDSLNKPNINTVLNEESTNIVFHGYNSTLKRHLTESTDSDISSNEFKQELDYFKRYRADKFEGIDDDISLADYLARQFRRNLQLGEKRVQSLRNYNYNNKNKRKKIQVEEEDGYEADNDNNGYEEDYYEDDISIRNINPYNNQSEVNLIKRYPSKDKPYMVPIKQKLRTLKHSIAVGAVSFGSTSIDQNRPMNIIYDTGSYHSWVIGVGWVRGQDRNRYETGDYTEKINDDFGVQYLKGDVLGSWVKDSIKIENTIVKNQDFGDIFKTDENIEETISHGLDGLIGLSFSSFVESPYKSLYDNLADQYAIKNKVFSYVEPRETGKYPRGEVAFGTCNRRIMNKPLLCFPVLKTKNKYSSWRILIDGVKYGDKYIGSSSTTDVATVDTGSTFIGLPPDAYKAFLKSLGSAIKIDNDVVIVDCDAKLENLSIVIYNYVFEIEPRTYCVRTENSCRLRVNTVTGKVILGGTFFKAYHALFDYDNHRVGFSTFNRELSKSSRSPKEIGNITSNHPESLLVEDDVCSCADREEPVSEIKIITRTIEPNSKTNIALIVGLSLLAIISISCIIYFTYRRISKKKQIYKFESVGPQSMSQS